MDGVRVRVLDRVRVWVKVWVRVSVWGRIWYLDPNRQQGEGEG